jgi:hypothetical protein
MKPIILSTFGQIHFFDPSGNGLSYVRVDVLKKISFGNFFNFIWKDNLDLILDVISISSVYIIVTY